MARAVQALRDRPLQALRVVGREQVAPSQQGSEEDVPCEQVQQLRRALVLPQPPLDFVAGVYCGERLLEDQIDTDAESLGWLRGFLDEAVDGIVDVAREREVGPEMKGKKAPGEGVHRQ